MKITENVYLVGSSEFGISGQGDCHVYLVDAGADLILIDTGDGSGIIDILAQVKADGLDPSRITHVLLTHAHRDHAGGLLGLRNELARRNGRTITAITSRKEADLLEKGSEIELGLDLLGFVGKSRDEVFPPVSVERTISDNEEFAIGSVRFRGIIVPGHNPGCVCYFARLARKNVLFSGDVVFHGGYISIGNWPGSNNEHYNVGIQKLSGLEVDVLLPSHHLWTIADGQSHIDRAVEAFHDLWPPPNLSQIIR